MLVNLILYRFIVCFLLVGCPFVMYQSLRWKLKEKTGSIISLTCVCVFLLSLFSPILLPSVHVVNKTDYQKKILIGFCSIKLDNGSKVRINGSGVVNNSERNLYVQSVAYGHGHGGGYFTNNIESYSFYETKIDGAFIEPPKSISKRRIEKNLKTKKWRYYLNERK